jgi:hypothetical protein
MKRAIFVFYGLKTSLKTRTIRTRLVRFCITVQEGLSVKIPSCIIQDPECRPNFAEHHGLRRKVLDIKLWWGFEQWETTEKISLVKNARAYKDGMSPGRDI